MSEADDGAEVCLLLCGLFVAGYVVVVVVGLLAVGVVRWFQGS